VLSDITNLPQAQAPAQDGKEGSKEPQSKQVAEAIRMI